MTKESQTLTLSANSHTELADDYQDVQHPGRKMGSRADLRDMMRMGKRQELSRNFGFLSIMGFTAVAMSTWLGAIGSSLGGPANGGLGTIVWVYLAVLVLWCSVVASLAEIASMAPTAGGQYHWVSEFAPPRISRLLSYVTGWLCVLGWQMAFMSISSAFASTIQGWMQLMGSSFEFNNWQSSFMVMAIAATATVFNTNIANTLPLLGGSLALLYICLFLAIFILLLVLAPRTAADTVFLKFPYGGSPGAVARSCVYGVFGPIYTLMAPDVATHMSEEIKHASLVLPRAMMASTIINGILGFVMLVTLCFAVGDIDDVLSSDLGPINQVLLNATNSAPTTVAISVLMEIVSIGCIFAAATAASRQLYAFARDKGVPFSSFLAHVRPGWNIPLNALLMSFGFVSLVSLINIGASRAVETTFSIAVSSLLCSYLISISCIRLKRWRNEPLPPRRWSLGKLGGPINDFAILFLSFLFILFLFPYRFPVTDDNMNYAVAVFGSAVVLSLVFYFIRGRHTYISPVTLVQKDG